MQRNGSITYCWLNGVRVWRQSAGASYVAAAIASDSNLHSESIGCGLAGRLSESWIVEWLPRSVATADNMLTTGGLARFRKKANMLKHCPFDGAQVHTHNRVALHRMIFSFISCECFLHNLFQQNVYKMWNFLCGLVFRAPRLQTTASVHVCTTVSAQPFIRNAIHEKPPKKIVS